MDEIVLFFKDFKLFIILFSIFPSVVDRLRRNRSIFYILEKYEINWLIDKHAFIKAFKKLIKEIRYVKINTAVPNFLNLI